MDNNENIKNFTFSLTYNIKTDTFETKLYHQKMEYSDLIRVIAAMNIKAGDITNMIVSKQLNAEQQQDAKQVELAFAAIEKDVYNYIQTVLGGTTNGPGNES